MKTHYVRVTLTDEAHKQFGKRTVLLRSPKPFDGNILTGLLCNRDGSPVERLVADTTRTFVFALSRTDCASVKPMTMNLHYGELETL